MQLTDVQHHIKSKRNPLSSPPPWLRSLILIKYLSHNIINIINFCFIWLNFACRRCVLHVWTPPRNHLIYEHSPNVAAIGFSFFASSCRRLSSLFRPLLGVFLVFGKSTVMILNKLRYSMDFPFFMCLTCPSSLRMQSNQLQS